MIEKKKEQRLCRISLDAKWHSRTLFACIQCLFNDNLYSFWFILDATKFSMMSKRKCLSCLDSCLQWTCVGIILLSLTHCIHLTSIATKSNDRMIAKIIQERNRWIISTVIVDAIVYSNDLFYCWSLCVLIYLKWFYFPYVIWQTRRWAKIMCISLLTF